MLECLNQNNLTRSTMIKSLLTLRSGLPGSFQEMVAMVAGLDRIPQRATMTPTTATAMT